MTSQLTKLRIATRQSPMALWQANFIKDKIAEKFPDISIELIGLTTQGDRNQTTSLAKLGGKSLFVKELQQALLNNDADIAVHSTKDMSVYSVPGLHLAAIYERNDPRDAFVSNQYKSFNELPKGAIIGTASPRRQSQLLAKRPDLKTKLLRGNVNTRLKKLDDGMFDAIILAASGLKRLDFESRINEYFNPEEMIPAIAQGALGIECRENDNDVLAYIQHLNHKPSEICITAERAVNQKLGGDCHTPIGAYAEIKNNQLYLSAMVGSMDGKKNITTKINGNVEDAVLLGTQAAEDLLAQGAEEILK